MSAMYAHHSAIITPMSGTVGSAPTPDCHALNDSSSGGSPGAGSSGVKSARRKSLKSPARYAIAARPGRLVTGAEDSPSHGQTVGAVVVIVPPLETRGWSRVPESLDRFQSAGSRQCPASALQEAPGISPSLRDAGTAHRAHR